ncbi:MAG: hypothetical protein GY847_38845 [Proteobacteria bacterium]|nr:hypothetical protein [Pseudomonadota bacterium]
MFRKGILISVAVVFFLFVLGSCSSQSQQENPDSGAGISTGDADTDSDGDSDSDSDSDGDSDSDSVHQIISGVSVEVHPLVKTFLVVRWKQHVEANSVWLEFSFKGEEERESPARSASVGDHETLILGAPGETEVSFKIVNEFDSSIIRSDTYTGTTGIVPSKMPIPEFISHNPSIAVDDRWLLGSVEDSASPTAYYENPFWLFILDRKGRVVWYYKDPTDARMLFPQVSVDGSHILVDKAGFDFLGGSINTRIQRLTLDHSYTEELKVPKISWGFDETEDGNIVYDTLISGTALTNVAISALKEIEPDGTIREIWRCDSWVKDLGLNPQNCYSNTVNWHAKRDTVILSMPRNDTVLEINKETGDVIRQWGSLGGSWDYGAQSTSFDFQHYAHITDDGTLLVSSHSSDSESQHLFLEYRIDESQETIEEIWRYGDGVSDYAKYSGEAVLLANGNRLLNYGTGGVIREVTSDKETAWEVVWDAAFSDERNNKFIGHTVFIDDLYALIEGPKE